MKHVSDSLQAFVSGELPPAQVEVVEAHLSACPQCRKEAEEALALWGLLGAAENKSPAADSIWPVVRSRTLGANGRFGDWFFGHSPWMRTGLATAAVAAGLVGGILVPGGNSPGALDSTDENSALLLDSSWLSGTSWLSGSGDQGLDEFILGSDSAGMENGS